MIITINEWEVTSEYWDNLMGEKGDWFQKYVMRPSILSLLGNINGLNILDAGCGNGYLSRYLARMGANVIGVDFSKKLLKKALLYNRTERLNVKYLQKDISSQLDLNMVFDRIISHNVIQEIKNYFGF
ncbi:MAG: class I SAM-dependent methyltransferase [Thermodesulfobacteriota bacterium]